MERAKGFEPSTPTLARLCSTPELRPLTGAYRGCSAPVGRRAVSIGPSPGKGKIAAVPVKPNPSQIRAKVHIRAPHDQRRMEHSLASLGLNLDEQKAVDRFRKDVVEPSMTKLVDPRFLGRMVRAVQGADPGARESRGRICRQGRAAGQAQRRRGTASSPPSSRCARSRPSTRCSRASRSPT